MRQASVFAQALALFSSGGKAFPHRLLQAIDLVVTQHRELRLPFCRGEPAAVLAAQLDEEVELPGRQIDNVPHQPFRAIAAAEKRQLLRKIPLDGVLHEPKQGLGLERQIRESIPV